jgi:hypothetical protein
MIKENGEGFGRGGERRMYATPELAHGRVRMS